MIDPVEPVTADSLLEPLVRTRVGGRRQRHGPMKACIENRDLRYRTKQLRDNVHAFEFGAIMERSKCRRAFDRSLDVSSNKRRLEMMQTTVNDSMPHDVNIGRAGNGLRVTAPQTLEQTLNRFCA